MHYCINYAQALPQPLWHLWAFFDLLARLTSTGFPEVNLNGPVVWRSCSEDLNVFVPTMYMPVTPGRELHTPAMDYRHCHYRYGRHSQDSSTSCPSRP